MGGGSVGEGDERNWKEKKYRLQNLYLQNFKNCLPNLYHYENSTVQRMEDPPKEIISQTDLHVLLTYVFEDKMTK